MALGWTTSRVRKLEGGSSNRFKALTITFNTDDFDRFLHRARAAPIFTIDILHM